MKTQFSRQGWAAIGIAVLAWMPPIQSHACACCAEPGQRFVYTEKFDGYVVEVFNALRFKPRADIFQTACGMECVQGIDEPEDSYSLELQRLGEGLQFELKGLEGGSEGTILFRNPKDLTSFETDRTPDHSSVSPILYKEWILKAPVSGAGVFKNLSVNEDKAELVLLGEGNSCSSEGDFSHWIMDFVGEGIDFRLYGAFER